MHPTAQPLKLPARCAPVPFAFTMSATLGGAMSAITPAVKTEDSDEYRARWLHACATAVSLVFPSVTFIAPALRRLVDRQIA